MGCDLSRGDDFNGIHILVPLSGDRFGVKTRCYVSEKSVLMLPASLRRSIQEFLEEGSLQVMDGTVLDMMEVYEDLDRYILDQNYDVRAIGFDPYNARAFLERWTRERRIRSRESRPGRQNRIRASRRSRTAFNRLLLFDQAIMQFTMGNCIALEDTNGNRKLYKDRRGRRSTPCRHCSTLGLHTKSTERYSTERRLAVSFASRLKARLQRVHESGQITGLESGYFLRQSTRSPSQRVQHGLVHCQHALLSSSNRRGGYSNTAYSAGREWPLRVRASVVSSTTVSSSRRTRTRAEGLHSGHRHTCFEYGAAAVVPVDTDLNPGNQTPSRSSRCASAT